MADVDRDNTAWMRLVVEELGWPVRSMVGTDGANAAWLLVQHADADAEFQRHCLKLMSAAPPDEVDSTEVAYLTDRVRLGSGLPQLFDTQVERVGGRYRPRDLLDPADVDARRADVGLGPIAGYLRLFESGQ